MVPPITVVIRDLREDDSSRVGTVSEDIIVNILKGMQGVTPLVR